MRPKIDVYSIMRNEIKILPYFLRHYESFAERIFVWEDQSDDGTREMLSAHPKVTMLDPGYHGADDKYYVEQLWPQYRTISRGYADWVMCVDADEFIYHPDLVNFLVECEKKDFKRIRCEGYIMCHPTFPTTEGQIYDEVKYGWRDNSSNKTVVFMSDVHMSFTPGRHQCIHNSVHPTRKFIGIKLLHFRCLGTDFMRDRNKRNCISMGIPYDEERRFWLPKGVGPEGQKPRARERGNIYKWFDRNVDYAERVVE